MDIFIQLGLFLTLLGIGFVVGHRRERRHFQEIERREEQLKQVLVFATHGLPKDQDIGATRLVVGSVVIAEDYFKRVSASLRSLFGGPLTVYESLIDRGRREAILRMKLEAKKLGADRVLNVRFETSSLSEDRGGQSAMFSAEFIAYGTALIPRSISHS